MFGPIVEKAKKSKLLPSLKDSDLRPAIVLPRLFWAFNLKLECRRGYELSWTCYDDNRLMLQNFAFLEIF